MEEHLPQPGMEGEPMPQKQGRKSLEELLREAEVEAQKYEGGESAPTHPFVVENSEEKSELPAAETGFQFSGLESEGDIPPQANLSGLTPSMTIGEEALDEIVPVEQEEPVGVEEVSTVFAASEEVPEEPAVAPVVETAKVEPVAIGPSLEEIEQELRKSQAWEAEVRRKEAMARMKKVPVLPMLVAVAVVFFTTLFFSSPGVPVRSLEVQFLANVVEGTPRILEDEGKSVVDRLSLQVGDRIQTYDEATTVEFFDRSRVTVLSGSVMEIRDISVRDGVVQLELLEGSLWLDTHDITTRMEVFAHGERSGQKVRGRYRSILGTFLITRSMDIVDSYSVTAPLYLVLDREGQESSTMIPPYGAARVYDSQLRDNVFNLEYSKARTEFRLRSYLAEYNAFVGCTEVCEGNGFYQIIQENSMVSQGYILSMRTEGQFLVRGLALPEGTVRILLQEWFPYLTLSEERMEREEFTRGLRRIAMALEQVMDAPSRPSAMTGFQDVLRSEVTSLEEYMRVRPLFLFLSFALPTDEVYPVKVWLREFEQELRTPQEGLELERRRFVERNHELYRLIGIRGEAYIVERLPAYMQELRVFVENHPQYMLLLQEARVLSENMLVAVPKLYETGIFEARFSIESLELSLVTEELRDPLRLEFARNKVDVMQHLYGQITGTTNTYLQQVYSQRMEQLITQFENLKIEEISFAVGPVRVLQSEFLSLRRDFLSLRGVAPDEAAQLLRRQTAEELFALENRGISRVTPTVEVTPEEERRALREQAQSLLQSTGMNLRMVRQDDQVPRLFVVNGTVMGQTVTAILNAETNAFSQIRIGEEAVPGVIDSAVVALFLETRISAPLAEQDPEEQVEQRNYYREQLQVARRQRVYESLLRYGVLVDRVSDIQLYTSNRENTELYTISKATVTVTLDVAQGRDNLTQPQTFTLNFTGTYNIEDNRVYDIAITSPVGGIIRLATPVAVNRVTTVVEEQFAEAFYRETYVELMKALFLGQGITVGAEDFEVAGVDFSLFTIDRRAVEISGVEEPVEFEGSLDVRSANVYEAQWYYENNTYPILTIPVVDLRARMQNTIREIELERQRQARAAIEAQQRREQEAAQRQRELEEQRFNEEALRFVEGSVPRQ